MVGKRMISFRYGTSGEIKEVIIIIIIVGIIIVGIIIVGIITIQVWCRYAVGMVLVCTPLRLKRNNTPNKNSCLYCFLL